MINEQFINRVVKIIVEMRLDEFDPNRDAPGRKPRLGPSHPKSRQSTNPNKQIRSKIARSGSAEPHFPGSRPEGFNRRLKQIGNETKNIKGYSAQTKARTERYNQLQQDSRSPGQVIRDKADAQRKAQSK
jgi:hypothetical protein